MGSNIQDLLNQIMNAMYGRDVRQSIHDAIEMCYDNTATGKTTAEAAATSANTAATAATNAATAANTAASNANDARDNANAAAAAAGIAKDNANTAATAANNAASAATIAKNNAATATTNANTATTNANAARDAANAAATAANAAKETATTAATNATNAAAAANTAAGNANTATSTANQAATNADTKASLAATAANNANTATTAANLATTNANAAKDAANTAATAANNAATSATSASSAANTAATKATNAATAATNAANTATARIADMESALGDAATAISDANTAAYNANVATTSANRATDRANTAAATIEGLTVDSVDGGPDTPASATLETISGHKNIHFVLRQGKTGASFMVKGHAYPSVSALEADITNPEVGDQYNVGSVPPYNIYRWTGSGWEDQGTIGSSMDQISAQDVQTIHDHGTVSNPTNKVLKVEGLTYLMQDLMETEIGGKVDKVTGKGLSTNDFTDAYKDRIDTLENNVTVLGTSKVDKVTGKGLSTNDFTNSFKAQVQLIGNDTLDTTAQTITAAINELNTDKEDANNKVIAFQNTPDDAHYPSELLVKTYLDLKAPINNPVFTGDPRSVTPISSANGTEIATAEFVRMVMSAVGNVGYLTYEIVS